MVSDLIVFGLGVLVGAIATAAIYHNNKAKADAVVDAAKSAAVNAEAAAAAVKKVV